jgi:hypothetical protein
VSELFCRAKEEGRSEKRKKLFHLIFMRLYAQKVKNKLKPGWSVA